MKTEQMAEAPSVLDDLLAAIAHDCGHDPERLRKKLLDDPAYRARYISPLVKLWCIETCNDLKKGSNDV